MQKDILKKRIKQLNRFGFGKTTGPVIYWMSRDQRAFDNYALFAAQQKAQESHSPLIVVFCLQKTFLGAKKKIFDFMIQGLMQVEKDLMSLNIPFFMLQGDPPEEIQNFIHNINRQILYTDFSPLRIGIKWRKDIAAKINIPFYEVDAHNVIPAWETSNKREFSARTIRPKIHSLLSNFLTEIPRLVNPSQLKSAKWDKIQLKLIGNARPTTVKANKIFI